MTPTFLLAELDASDAICKRAIAYNGTDQDSIVDDPIWKFIVHARDALPARNAQLRAVLPFVQHLPGCDDVCPTCFGEGGGIVESGNWLTCGTCNGRKYCSCGLAEKLKAAGVE